MSQTEHHPAKLKERHCWTELRRYIRGITEYLEALVPINNSPSPLSGTALELCGKEIVTNYILTSVAGDGRCLFRAVAHGWSLRSGKEVPNDMVQRELADELRHKAMEELIRRRNSDAWYIEGDFEEYVELMRKTSSWGGEPELIMLTHVLQMPITVFRAQKETKETGKLGLIVMSEYGQEYHTDIDPIQVFYNGKDHYQALHIINGSEERPREHHVADEQIEPLLERLSRVK